LTIVISGQLPKEAARFFFEKNEKFFRIVQQNQFLPCHYPGKALEPVFNFTLLYK